PRALPLLPDSAKGGGAEGEKRLTRVREALRAEADKTNLGASKVTIRGKGLRLTEVLQQLQAQSDNVITDLREQEGGEASNPALNLEVVHLPSSEALH